MNMHNLREHLCNELEAVSSGKMTTDKINLIDMLTHSIKSIDTINAMEREGYSNRYMRSNNNSYDGSYNSYNNYDSSRDRDRNSYDRSYNNSYGDGYSRTDMNEEIKNRLAEMLDRANNDSEREAIRRTMNMM